MAAPALAPAGRRRTWQRRFLRYGVTALIGYLGVLLVLLALENFFVYHPTRASENWIEAPPALRHQDVELRAADGVPIHAWWCPTENWQPSQGALLYCHGNAGNLSHRGEGLLRWHQRLNGAVFIFDYPGYGRSEGKPTEIGCYAAADAAYDWLTGKLRVPPERILMYGGSLGCAVATDLACRKPCRGLVLVSPFTSIPDMAQKQFPWLPGRWLVRQRFDSLAKIGKCRVPVFIAHGTADRLIPFSQGERLHEAANEPKCFFPMVGYDHNHTPGSDFYDALHDFLAKATSAGA